MTEPNGWGGGRGASLWTDQIDTWKTYPQASLDKDYRRRSLLKPVFINKGQNFVPVIVHFNQDYFKDSGKAFDFTINMRSNLKINWSKKRNAGSYAGRNMATVTVASRWRNGQTSGDAFQKKIPQVGAPWLPLREYTEDTGHKTPFVGSRDLWRKRNTELFWEVRETINIQKKKQNG